MDKVIEKIKEVPSSPSKEKKKDKKFLLPAASARKFYERASTLFCDGDCSSVELERAIKELMKATSYMPNQYKHYVLYGNIFKKAMDLSSAIYMYRYAYRLDEENLTIKKLLASALSQQGQEILYLAGKSLEKQKREIERKLLNNETLKKTSSFLDNGSGGVREVENFHDKYDLSLYEKALSRFNEALRLEHSDYRIWVFKTQCHARLRQYNDGLQAISRAMASCKDTNVEFYILRAKLYWAKGFNDEGNKDIRVACSLDPEHIEIKAYISRSYAKAELLFQKALQFFEAGNYEKSLFNLKHALCVSNDDIKLHIMLAKLYRVMQRLDEAYAAIQKATTLYKAASGAHGEAPIQLPEDISKQTNLIFNDLGLRFMSEGQYTKAIVLFNKVIENELKLCQPFTNIDYRFYVNRGDCYRALEVYDEGIADYLTALKISSNNWDIRTRLSVSHYMQGIELFNIKNEIKEAEIKLTKAIEYNPKISEYFTVRGRTRYLLCDYSGSFEDYSESIRLNPENDDVREALKQFQGMDLRKDETKTMKEAFKEKKQSVLDKLDAEVEKLTSKPVQRTSQGISVAPVKVTKEDTIAMLLNPKAARKLPDVLQQKRDYKPITNGCGKKSMELLPMINPNLTTALLVREEAIRKRNNLKQFLTLKVDTTAKSPLFDMFETARELARSTQESKKNPKQKRKPMKALSAVALKRLSQEKSLLALKEGTAVLSETHSLHSHSISNSNSQHSGSFQHLSSNPKNFKGKVLQESSDFLELSDESDDECMSLHTAHSHYSHNSNSDGRGGSPSSINSSDSNHQKYHLKALEMRQGESEMFKKKQKKKQSRRLNGGNGIAFNTGSSSHSNSESNAKRGNLITSDEHSVHSNKSVGSNKSKNNKEHVEKNTMNSLHFGTVKQFWDESDTLKHEQELESTLLLSEEEEIELVKQQKIEMERLKAEQREIELAKLKSEVR